MKLYYKLMILLAALAVIAGVAWPQFEVAAQNTACYFQQGGAKFVAGSGCEIEIQSGAIFDLQSGSTTDFSGGVDLDGATLIFDADGDTTAVASTDDLITLTINSATGRLDVATGNVKIGNGTPDQTQNGEDLYVEGMFEADGAAYLDNNISSNDGAITATDNVAVSGQADAVQLAVTGYTTQTNDLVQLNGGLVDVGGGTYGTADGDNDLGVDGDIEANGNVVFGTNNLYPLGYASVNQQIVCGTTAAFTGSTNITDTGLSTVTYVIATQVTAPITTAAYLHANDPTGITVTLTSLNNTFGAGTTGISVHYCAIGDE